ncbi:MAG TPA: beta-ketoacyl-ACP synthase III [Gemmatimonadaceae bacterium]|nr:beta-ketoacyl-ACP synthase III [Gemmatimonadaceae bacterium]
MKRPNVQISAVGRSVPSRVMTNYDFAAIGIETTHEWVMERTGIAERHIAGPTDTTCSMGAAASRIAMQRAGVQPGEIDIIICSTATPDRLLPATAVDIQAELGATRAAGFDISAACCGFLYGLSMAEGLIQSGAAETVLLVSSEKLSAITDWTDRATCVLFGDGAGAAILRRSQKGRGILSTFMRSDGTLADLLYRPAGGATTPMSPAVLEARTHLIHMAGREVFKHAVRSMAESADRALDMARINSGDIDLLIPHQANLRIIEATAKHASIPMSKVYVNVDRYGNTSSASIPIALDEAIQNGIVGEGSLVLMVAFGAGFTWASSVVRL